VWLTDFGLPAPKRHIHSLRALRLIFTASIDFSARRCERIRTLNHLRAQALGDLAIAIDAVEINGPVWSVSGRGTTGAFRSSRADSGAQVFPPARATVPPWLRESSSRVSSLPVCYALGPPACAAPCSCRREAAAPIGHGRASTRLARPLASSTAAGSSVRPNEGLKARPHALPLARKRFITHL
jgi:hypothetical protein